MRRSIGWVMADIITQLQWTIDMGSSPGTAYAVMCGQQAGDPINQQTDSRYWANNGATSAAWFRDLCLIGPAIGISTVGAVRCNVSGTLAAAHRMLTNVRISGFMLASISSAIILHLDMCRSIIVTYGWYIKSKLRHICMEILRPTENVSISTCRMACVSFAYGGAPWAHKQISRPYVHLGTSPFCFFKEATPASLR